MKLALACRTGQGDDLDRKAQAALYVEQLADLPFHFLAAAVDEWIKTQVFFPAIAEIRALTARKAEWARRELEFLKREQERRAEAEREKSFKRVPAEKIAALRQSIGAAVKAPSRPRKAVHVHLSDEERERLLAKASAQ